MMTENGKSKTSADTRVLTRITAVLTALVALNTLVISCAQRREGQLSAELARASNQVQYWEDAMRDLDGLLQSRPPMVQIEAVASQSRGSGSTLEPELAAVDNWLGRCRLLSSRTLSYGPRGPQTRDAGGEAGEEVNESATPSTETSVLLRRADELFRDFRSQMQNDEIVGRACAELAQDTEQEAIQRVNIQRNAAASESETDSSSNDEAVSLAFLSNEANIVMNRSEIDSRGYDIDLFWCDRLNQPEAVRENIVQAANFARRLSNRADEGERFQGERLGRIRLRRLSVGTQEPGTGPGYPSSGVQFRFDQGEETEGKLARAMSSLVDGARPRPQGRSSPYYISGFFCAEGALIAGGAAD